DPRYIKVIGDQALHERADVAARVAVTQRGCGGDHPWVGIVEVVALPVGGGLAEVGVAAGPSGIAWLSSERAFEPLAQALLRSDRSGVLICLGEDDQPVDVAEGIGLDLGVHRAPRVPSGDHALEAARGRALELVGTGA